MKLTSSEASVAATITMAKARRNAPVTPVMKMIGPQTATSTRVIAMAAIPISERPSTAAVTLNPLRYAVAFVGKVLAANARRQALHNLLALPADCLDDLGINRTDLFDAMGTKPLNSGRFLAERRAENSSNWLNP